MDIDTINVAIVPLILGVVELLKQVGLPQKFAPLVSAVIGIIIGIFYIAPGDLLKGILLGLVMGLSATGLYSGTKTTVAAFTKK